MSSQGLPQKPRSSRPVRAAAANSALRYSAEPKESNGVNGYSYKEDQQYYSGSEAAPRVDLTKLKVQALRKYAKVYDIPYHPSTGKEDLAGLISRHWDKMVVSEEQVLQALQRVRGRH